MRLDPSKIPPKERQLNHRNFYFERVLRYCCKSESLKLLENQIKVTQNADQLGSQCPKNTFKKLIKKLSYSPLKTRKCIDKLSPAISQPHSQKTTFEFLLALTRVNFQQRAKKHSFDVYYNTNLQTLKFTPTADSQLSNLTVFPKPFCSALKIFGSQLACLSLSDCILTETALIQFCRLIKVLTSLTHVELVIDTHSIKNHTLDILDKNIIFMSNLVSLNLTLYNIASNKVLNIFSKIKVLRSLALSFETTSQQKPLLDKVIDIRNLFQSLPQLQKFRLNFNRYKIGPVGTQGLSDLLEKLEDLESLDISALKMNFLDNSITSIISAISQMKKLKSLNLSQKDSKGWSKVVSKKIEMETFPWRNLSQLESLTLCFLSVWHEPRKKLLRKINSLKKLKHLTLMIENNTLELGAGDADLVLISHLIKELPQLATFNFSLSGQVLDKDSWVKFSESISTLNNMSTLKLYLRENELTERGLEALGKAISRLKNLQSLSLHSLFNFVSNDGVKLFINALISGVEKPVVLKGLEEMVLEFSDYKITDLGIGLIIKALKFFKGLKRFRLNVTTCKSIDKALKEIIAKHGASLKRLDELKLNFYLLMQKKKINQEAKNYMNRKVESLSNHCFYNDFHNYHCTIQEIDQ